MLEGKLKVFSVGADWFFREMQEQDMEVHKIDWAPPPETPDDIRDILSLLKGV